METRMMILPYGDVLVGVEQHVGYSEAHGWHLYWYYKDGDKYISVRHKKSSRALMKIAKENNWTVSSDPPF